jgi:hypothetical protein
MIDDGCAAPKGAGYRCDRSGRAASVKAAWDISQGTGSPYGAETSVHLWHLACSGARIDNFGYTTTLTVPAETHKCSDGLNCMQLYLARAPEIDYSGFIVIQTPTQNLLLNVIIPAGQTSLEAKRLTQAFSFPVGTRVLLPDYGDGGVLTPYDGAHSPVSQLCIPAKALGSSGPFPPLPRGCKHAALPSQLDKLEQLIALSHGRRPDVLLMTIGANDLGWAEFLEKCYPWLLKPLGLDKAIGDKCLESQYTGPITHRLKALP